MTTSKKIDWENVKLDEYEEEVSDMISEEHMLLGRTQESQILLEQLQERATAQKTTPVTFKVKTKEFEVFKQNAKQANVPYSKVLNFLIELWNR